ncbi:hypothetical protein Purlil1_7566 [Purpureocillium lilacinum]|uniref:Uncharacterized protein n=1 Tax=Purpureocillium lilacinum TaxID=33203 RepID=A0ABR0BVQ4_PURLI|nr:hypothetical protein Purlil1_7566 [Purpureocillium lilacinum]
MHASVSARRTPAHQRSLPRCHPRGGRFPSASSPKVQPFALLSGAEWRGNEGLGVLDPAPRGPFGVLFWKDGAWRGKLACCPSCVSAARGYGTRRATVVSRVRVLNARREEILLLLLVLVFEGHISSWPRGRFWLRLAALLQGPSTQHGVFRGRCAGRSFNPPPRTKDTGKEASPEAPAVRASTLSANTNGEQWMHGPIRRATARAYLDGQITLERVSKLRGKTS